MTGGPSGLQRITERIYSYGTADRVEFVIAPRTDVERLLALSSAAQKLVAQPFGQLSERDFYVVREALSAMDSDA